MSRRKDDKRKQYTLYALVALLFLQGLANSFLYGTTLWALYKFDALVDAVAQKVHEYEYR